MLFNIRLKVSLISHILEKSKMVNIQEERMPVFWEVRESMLLSICSTVYAWQYA